MMRRLLILLVLSLIMVSGCASRSHRLNFSYWPEGFPTEAVVGVAEHLADMMVANYPPGYTSFFLSLTGDSKDELGPALEAALRSRGFTLVPEKGGQAMTVSYILDRVDEATWYSKLAISNGFSLTRTWSWTDGGLAMEAATKTGRLDNTDGQK